MNTDLMNAVSHVVAAYLARNDLDEMLVPALIHEVALALHDAGGIVPLPGPVAPAVPVEQSMRDDVIVCLECGRKVTMLGRHIRATHGLTMDAYRARWNLQADYPAVAPAYARRRAEIARRSGFQPGH